ncbi:hypothetical protein [Bacillus solitudinis]|uniref:hypothetical protein n=1 Tax=Bacillus solitudinis TaxID=2014074 RepID=UPI000C2444B3|nr:hypothetical protein [Bacillus solitudinis]
MWNWKFSVVLITLLLMGCQKAQVDEGKVLNHYDHFLEDVGELFRYHAEENEMFYNERYQTKEEVDQLLKPYMTEKGISQIKNDFFVEVESRLVYKEDFQLYLRERGDYRSFYSGNRQYYDVIRESVINPGLRLINPDIVKMQEENGRILMEGIEIPIYFYHEQDVYAQQQFGQLGYPSNDLLSISVSFVSKGNTLLIDQIQIGS